VSGFSVLTLARGREPHLRNLVEGLRRSQARPAELIVVDMNDEPISLAGCPFPARTLRLPGDRLPLAAARNLAAREASGSRLLFLDADCIPSVALLGALAETLDAHDGLLCPETLYLDQGATDGAWNEARLFARGRPHPARPFPSGGVRLEPNPGLFWSLAFAARRETFEALGGFDETFVGYGGEDTDLGFRAAAAGAPLIFVGGAFAFHQHHPVSDPPIEHLHDIVANARTFFAKWGRWPMEGWLDAFEAAGRVRRSRGSIEIVDEAGRQASSGRDANQSA